jgi:hypothetical protein
VGRRPPTTRGPRHQRNGAQGGLADARCRGDTRVIPGRRQGAVVAKQCRGDAFHQTSPNTTGAALFLAIARPMGFARMHRPYQLILRPQVYQRCNAIALDGGRLRAELNKPIVRPLLGGARRPAPGVQPSLCSARGCGLSGPIAGSVADAKPEHEPRARRPGQPAGTACTARAHVLGLASQSASLWASL